MTSKPKVLVAAANRGFGGAERHIVDLTTSLSSQYSFTVLSPRKAGLKELTQTMFGGVTFAHRFVEFSSTIGFFRLLWRLLRSGRFSLLHLHGPRAIILGRIAVLVAKHCGSLTPPVVSTTHGELPLNLRLRRLYQCFYYSQAARDAKVIAVSRATRRELILAGVSENTVTVIQNETVSGSETPAPPVQLVNGKVPVFAFVGRFVLEKGIDVLIDALTQIRQAWGECPQVHLFGDGPLLRQSMARADSLSLDGLQFHGLIYPAKMSSFYRTFDVLLMPSRTEGLPYALLEALAAGRAIVAADVGGIPEVFDGTRGGTLITPDDPSALASAITDYIGSPHLVLKHQRESWALSRELFKGEITQKVDKVYQDTLDDAAPRKQKR